MLCPQLPLIVVGVPPEHARVPAQVPDHRRRTLVVDLVAPVLLTVEHHVVRLFGLSVLHGFLNHLLLLGQCLFLKQAGGGFADMTCGQVDLEVVKDLVLGAGAQFGGVL